MCVELLVTHDSRVYFEVIFSVSLYRSFGSNRQHARRPTHQLTTVCLKIEIHEIHEIYEIHMPKYRNPPTMYKIHCLKIEIHKVHEIHSKSTLAKYRNPQTVRNPHWQGSQQTNRQLL